MSGASGPAPRKVALVTGASTGIGKALLPHFCRDQHDLILVARREDMLQGHKVELERDFGVSVHVIALDLTKPGAAASLHAQVNERGLAVDVLVNNAGFGLYGLFDEQPLERLQEMMALNIVALTELTRLFVSEMKQRGRGRIMQVASLSAFQPGPRMAVYYASKAYVLSLSEALHRELAGTGVTVTALCPGPTATEFSQVADYASALFDKASMTSEDVAAIGYRGLMRGERLVVAGTTNRALSVLSQLSPRGAVLAITDKLMRARGDA